ncbi:MAG TPA: hypothetical protein VKA38_16265 [Draconibacterium sp.]|nr:hypothetical protein [Draconibacterium sp.]
MYSQIENREQKVFSFIASCIIFYVAFVGSLCYEMGKNGLGNINWNFILQMNVPVFIISATLFFRAFHIKKNRHENS